jgi:hypothetical protein
MGRLAVCGWGGVSSAVGPGWGRAGSPPFTPPAPHLVHADVCEVVAGRPQPDGLRYRRRPGLEAHGRRRVGRVVEKDVLDHLAAPHPGLHALEEVVPGGGGLRVRRATSVGLKGAGQATPDAPLQLPARAPARPPLAPLCFPPPPPTPPGNTHLPHRNPMPVGPSILWELATTQSTPSAWTSTGMCGTDWHASRSTRAPTPRARATTVGTSSTQPRVLETWTRLMSLVRGVTSSRRCCAVGGGRGGRVGSRAR